jgi:hypothetical protein
MQNYLSEGSSSKNPEYRGLFFQRAWLDSEKKDGIFREHLYAYLQEPCYWSAREIDRTFGHTFWSLLLKSSEKRLREALNGRVSEAELENHLMAWDYYKEIYAGNSIEVDGKVQEPSPEIWQKITDRYNRENRGYLDRREIQKRLTVAGQALSNYLSPIQPLSIERSTEGENRSGGEDSIADPSKNPLDILISEEESIAERESVTAILQWLARELEGIEPARRAELEMYYGRKMSLQKIAESVTPPGRN